MCFYILFLTLFQPTSTSCRIFFISGSELCILSEFKHVLKVHDVIVQNAFIYNENRFSWACSHSRPHCSGCPFSSPHLKGARLRNSGPGLSARFECCARHHPGHGGHFGKPMKEGVPGLQRGLKATPPRLTYSIFRSDCQIPAID